MAGRPFGRDIPMEFRVLSELDTWRSTPQGVTCHTGAPNRRIVSLRIEDADRNPEFLVDDPHRLRQVRIIRNHHELVAILAEGIDKHVGGDVHVGALFLHLDYLCEARTPRQRHRKWHLDGAL